MNDDNTLPPHDTRSTETPSTVSTMSAASLHDTGYRKLERDESRFLIQHLCDEKINPVLIIGTNTSGKTLIIHSLLAYASKPDNEFTISRGPAAFPTVLSTIQERSDSAESFFNDLRPIYRTLKLPPGTINNLPFFISVDLNYRNLTTHFAFLEHRGEYFERSKYLDNLSLNKQNSTKDFEFTDEHITLLETYPGPLTVIFVAPALNKNLESQKEIDNRRSDITYAIKKHRQFRKNFVADNILLLFSKWDSVANPGDDTGTFAMAREHDVRERYFDWEMVYNDFAQLPVGRQGSRSMMPYSAGWIIQPEKVVPHQHIPAFDRFNRTLWNWLYGNINKDEKGRRAVLCPDVDPSSVSDPASLSPLNRAYYRMASSVLWIKP